MLRKLSYSTLLAIIIGLIALDFAWLNIGLIIDQRFGDVLQRQLAQSRPASNDIIIIDIDQKSLEEMNEKAESGSWPWPRSIHGEMVQYIAAQNPKAIVFDILFNEPDTFRPEHDQILQQSIADLKNVYFPYQKLPDGDGKKLADLPKSLGILPNPNANKAARATLLLPNVIQQEKWQGGLINFNADSDGIGRYYLAHANVDGWLIPSLPDKLARDFNWPKHDAERTRLNWQTGRQHIPFSDVYLAANSEQSNRPANEFSNKIVIIGTAAPGLQDLRPTSMGQLYPGVEILATAIDNRKHGDWLRDVPRIYFIVVALLLCSLLAWGFAINLNTMTLAASMLGISLLAALSMWLGLKHYYFLPLASAIAWAWLYFWVAALVSYLAEKATREHAIALFSRFLDSRVVGELISSGEIDLHKPAEAREITVLFSDIRGFTTLSESHDAAYIVQLLNRYFTLQVEIIFKHGGTLDKFIGDAIMAFWGAPANDPEHARHAIEAALEMSQALEQFKLELKDLNAHFDVGIGIHTGSAVVGFIGSESRLDYTVIGDTVNLSSRIEGLTKGKARILVSDSTRAACAEHFNFIEHGSHTVKGREQAVQLFEPQEKNQ
ncbi:MULTISPECIES: adenylate/guanylate cyclase domain-containing protein [Deefgea]|uniref:CHASE2 domain-containing protein n=1 Tax=Deefgea chitinilytica TaxID=570276 RepID=A0ABS2CBL4_9NEIS|nr:MULTISPECIES: adenylate/guanylate cyclase domain-containing protein [Deefgea]MBM5571467.1 CHASE2 domain-containing protein [Deefgea chitinilytica]MBM9888700.1 adenylate/guanylate cyclase domain-containing protein [Deefgea sp. CFH1-16]